MKSFFFGKSTFECTSSKIVYFLLVLQVQFLLSTFTSTFTFTQVHKFCTFTSSADDAILNALDLNLQIAINIVTCNNSNTNNSTVMVIIIVAIIMVMVVMVKIKSMHSIKAY